MIYRSSKRDQVDGITIEWNVFKPSENGLNEDIFCKSKNTIYDPQFYNSVKDYIFYSTSSFNNNKYKLICQPSAQVMISFDKLRAYVTSLWKYGKYSEIFILFKQLKSLQSVILLDKPKDEHISARISDKYLKEITTQPSRRKDGIILPTLVHDADKWFKCNQCFFPSFSVSREFFTFDALRTLLVIWQSTILNRFKDLYDRYNNDDISPKSEKITQIKEVKQSFVYDKGLVIAKLIFNQFCEYPDNYTKPDNEEGIEFSVCYIESTEQYKKEYNPYNDTYIVQGLYHKFCGHKKVNEWRPIEIKFKQPKINTDLFTFLVYVLMPFKQYISWDQWFSKCVPGINTETDYINLFNQKLSDADKERLMNSRDDQSIDISDIILRTLHIHALINNDLSRYGVSDKKRFIEDVFMCSRIIDIKNISKLSLFDVMYASDSFNVGTGYCNCFFKEKIETDINVLKLKLMEHSKIFKSIIAVAQITNNMPKQLRIMCSNISALFGLDVFKEFIQYLISYGETELKLSEAHTRKFSDVNEVKYCEIMAVIFYLRAFTRTDMNTILSTSDEQSVITAYYLVKYKEIDTEMFSKISDKVRNIIETANDALLTRSSIYLIQDIKDMLA